MKKVLVGLLVVIIIAVAGVYVALNTGKKVDVTWNEADYDSAMQKSGVQIADIREVNLITLAKNDYAATGEVPVDASFTNSEMSAIIDKANAEGGPISDFKVAFIGDQKGEMSFKLTENFIDFIKEQNMILLPSDKMASGFWYASVASTSSISDTVVNFITNVAANKPVYASGTLARTTDKSVSIHIESLKVGQITMSAEVVARVEEEVLQFVNTVLASTEGFEIQELRVEDGALYYKGTLPAELQGRKIGE